MNHAPVPGWLTDLAWISLAVAALCALIVVVDILAGRRQKMAIMNWVWPITQLYMGPLGLCAYYRFGRAPAPLSQADAAPMHGMGAPAMAGRKGGSAEGGKPDGKASKTDFQTVFKGVTHCGAGCTLGDVAGDWAVFALGLTIAGVAFWPKLIGEFALAYLFGVVFQYFAIAPMRHLGLKEGILAAIKADTLSITAYEVGMFAWMALMRFGVFGRDLPPTLPAYWFLMQIAMLAGFATAYPMNVWLIRKGWKEAM